MNYQDTIVETVEKVLPGVVSISVAKDPGILEKEIFSELFRMGVPFYSEDVESKIDKVPRDKEGRIKIGGGSGFVINKEGIILTNKHVVIDPNAEYSAITSAGERYSAKVLARDPINDIAILKVDDKKFDLPVVELGDSEDIKLGQGVIAIGNALGQFQNTVSTGVVSGLSRFIQATVSSAGHQERLRGLIQTDAAINPGNSGGPLVGLDGKAIAINTAVVFGAQNIGFAIPIDRAKKDLEEIKKHSRIRRPFLGVRYLILNKEMKDKLHFPFDYGALVINEGIPGDEAVIPGSASDKAGIQERDIILTCNDKKITEEETLEDLLSSSSVGDKVELEILRNKEKMTVNVTLEEMK